MVDQDQDPDAPPTEDELRAAGALAAALEAGGRAHEDASFLRAARLAHAPTPLDAPTNERLVRTALARAPVSLAARRARIGRAGGFMSALALAAGVLLAIWSRAPGDPRPPLAQSRSTQALFREPFKGSEAVARIDRIATARASDLRENRFAAWGVR